MVATSLFAPLAGQTVDSGCRGVIEDLEARDKRLTRDYESALLMCKQGHMRESKASVVAYDPTELLIRIQAQPVSIQTFTNRLTGTALL